MLRDLSWTAGIALLAGCYSARSGSVSTRAVSDPAPAGSSACESSAEFVPLALIPEGYTDASVLAVSSQQLFWVSSDTRDSVAHYFHWSAEQGVSALDPGSLAPGQVQLSWSSGDASVAVVRSYDPETRAVIGSFLWLPGKELRPLDLLALAVNRDGTVIAGLVGDQPARWTEAGGVQVLGPAGHRLDLLSASGDVLAGDDGQGHCLRWTEATGFEDLGALGPDPAACSVLLMNDSGDVLFGRATAPDTEELQAFRWSPETGMVNLELSRPSSAAQPELMSSDGSALLSSVWSRPGKRHLSLWTEAGGRDLQPPTESPVLYFSYHVSSRGAAAIGGRFDGHSAQPMGFRWTEGSGVQDLDLEISQPGVALDGGLIVGNGPAGPQILRFGDLGAGAALIEQLPPRIVPDAWSEPALRGVSADGKLLFGEARDAAGTRSAWLQHLSCANP